MVTSAGSSPVVTGDHRAQTVLASLDDFPLGRYVTEVRESGRASLSADTRTTAAALFRRVREVRKAPAVEPGMDRTLRFAEAVLRPQWAMQLPGGKRYETYSNATVLDWVLALDHQPDLDDRLARCGETVHRKARSWHAYEMATMARTTLWNQLDVEPDRLGRRIRLLHKLIEFGERLGWAGDGSDDVTSADLSWAEYAHESSGAHALEFLTTLPQTPQHDEIGFLTTIHIGECCFAAMHSCVAQAISEAEAGEPNRAARHLQAAKPFADAFDLAFTALVTMSSQQFRRFVAATGQASAVQSRRYQQLDSLLYGLHPAKKEAIGLFPELADIRPGPALTLDRLLRRHLGDRGFEPVVVAAQSLDTALYRWRARHFGASNRLYPYTGLELGSEYLGSHYSHRLSAVSHLQERPGHR